MAAGKSISDQRADLYRKAASKKSRYQFGLIAGLVFTFLGFFINEIVILGGALVLIVSVINLAACNFAEKQLRLMEVRKQGTAPEAEKKESPKIEERDCPHCGKETPANSNFCEQCGKRIQNA